VAHLAIFYVSLSHFLALLSCQQHLLLNLTLPWVLSQLRYDMQSQDSLLINIVDRTCCTDMVQIEIERQERLAYLRNKAHDLRITETQLCLQLSELRESLRRVSSEEAEITNLSAPISRIPNEILTEIFGHMKGSYGANDIPHVMVVSHVTRHWRNVALGSPSLWDTIRMSTANDSLDLPIAFLTRSKPCTLNITLEIPEDAPMSGLQLIPILIPHFDHIRHLVIECGDNELVVQRLVESFLDFQAPSLEHFEISLDLGNSQDSLLWNGRTRIFTGGTPILSSVVLKGISLRCCSPPLSTVTHLTLDSEGDGTMLMSYDYFCNALNACHSLTWLELRGRLFAFGSSDAARQINLPSLVSFAIGYPIRYRQDHYVRSTFETISAPALQTLSLNYMHRLTLQVVVHFIQSRALYPMLQHLRLEEPAVECMTVNSIRAMASVTHVTLMYVGGIPRKMAALAPLLDRKYQSVSQADILWPRLHTLTICGFDDVFIRDLITTRIVIGAPLVTLRIESGTYDTLLPCQIEWCRSRVKLESVAFEDL
jgi:hypothetical protein